MRAIAITSRVGLALLLAACGASSTPPLASIDAVDRVRASAPTKEAEKIAPQAVALADVDRKKADEALAQGDEVAADLYATRALVSLEHAIVLGRLARAASLEQAARARAEQSTAQVRELVATRTKIEAENAELEKKVKIARELTQPPVSGPADPKREAARKTAAESLLAQARLLCGAARLVAKEPSADLDEAEKLVTAKPTSPATGAQAVDAAARARAACLSALTRIRRGSPEAARGVHADALLADLTATHRFDVTRDERGVVITLRDAFDGAKLKKESEDHVAELGRVLRANSAYRAQVVVHDFAKREDGSARAKAVVALLAQSAGVSESKVASEDAGTKLPIADPADARLRPRNARLEVVFVSPVN